MPSLGDSAVIILLGLLLFGPKGLAQIARQLGKLMGEFRRASNEFRMQMEEELRLSEQADRRKQIDAMEAAAPVAPSLESTTTETETTPEPAFAAEKSDGVLPIATSGELSIMPPSTGLPTPQTKSNPLGSLIESIPEVPQIPEVPRTYAATETENEHAPETAAHGS